MKIKYTDDDGKEKTLTFTNGTWAGTDLAKILNQSVAAFLGRSEYFPTNWHLAKTVADKLGGTIDTPEPDPEIAPNAQTIF